MSRFQLWCARTVRNWRWWVVLPTLPLAVAGVVMEWAGEKIAFAINKALRWQRKGWKA